MPPLTALSQTVQSGCMLWENELEGRTQEAELLPEEMQVIHADLLSD